jgi:hypothetical protein
MCARIAGPSRLRSTHYPGPVAAVDEGRGQAHADGFFWYPSIRIRTALEPAGSSHGHFPMMIATRMPRYRGRH